MVDLIIAAAVALLALGVVGSLVPLLPAAPLSLAGVYLYWWHTGYAEPSLPVLAGFTLVGLFAAALDYFGGAVAASAGGASSGTVFAAALAGVALFFVTGPLGAILGVAVTVFVLEFRRHDDARRGVRTALYATAGVLGSVLVQLLLTGAMLVAFLVVVLV